MILYCSKTERMEVWTTGKSVLKPVETNILLNTSVFKSTLKGTTLVRLFLRRDEILPHLLYQSVPGKDKIASLLYCRSHLLKGFPLLFSKLCKSTENLHIKLHPSFAMLLWLWSTVPWNTHKVKVSQTHKALLFRFWCEAVNILISFFQANSSSLLQFF